MDIPKDFNGHGGLKRFFTTSPFRVGSVQKVHPLPPPAGDSCAIKRTCKVSSFGGGARRAEEELFGQTQFRAASTPLIFEEGCPMGGVV